MLIDFVQRLRLRRDAGTPSKENSPRCRLYLFAPRLLSTQTSLLQGAMPHRSVTNVGELGSFSGPPIGRVSLAWAPVEAWVNSILRYPANRYPLQPGVVGCARILEESVAEHWRLSATELARLIRMREVSAREAAEAALQRLDAVNPHINAVVVHRPDSRAPTGGCGGSCHCSRRGPRPSGRRPGHGENQCRSGGLRHQQWRSAAA